MVGVVVMATRKRRWLLQRSIGTAGAPRCARNQAGLVRASANSIARGLAPRGGVHTRTIEVSHAREHGGILPIVPNLRPTPNTSPGARRTRLQPVRRRP